MRLDNVLSLATEAKLNGIRDTVEGRSAQALEEQMHPLELVALLLEDELLHKKNLKSQRLLKKARFRYKGELEEWDTSYDRGLSQAKMKELSSLNFYKSCENLIILGKSGEGKTHLSNSIGRRLCYAGVETLFFSTNLLFEDVAAERAAGTYLKFLKRLNKASVIILDDFGLRNYNHDEANVLIDLIEERYRKGIVIITSQVNPKGWGELFEDPVIGEAIIDRLINPAKTIKLKGGSYRPRLESAA